MKEIRSVAFFIMAGVAFFGCDGGGGDHPEVVMTDPVDRKVFYETTDGTGGISITFNWTVDNFNGDFTSKIIFDKSSNPYDGGIEFSKVLEPNSTSYTHFFQNGWWRGDTQWGVIVNDKYYGQTFNFEIIKSEISGCMDKTAINYNPDATVDDGSCKYHVYGCMDEAAINYNPDATMDDGSCKYPVPGCMDKTAINYNPDATVDDGSCKYHVYGCMDETAINYNPDATMDDGSCKYPVPGCMDKTAINYNPDATVDDGSCKYHVYGCMDETAINYNPDATMDDGSCKYPVPGCMDKTAINYNPDATVDDGSCKYLPKVIMEPTNKKVFDSKGVTITFFWKVENIEGDFIPKICFDKGVNPYDGSVEYCETLGKNVTSYTHYFSYGWWSGGAQWGVIVNDAYHGQTYTFNLNSGTNIENSSGACLAFYNYGYDAAGNPYGGAHAGFSSNTQRLNEDFNFLSEHGIKIVRVFIFCDLRSGLIYDDAGKPIDFDQYVMDDFSALVLAAKKYNLKIIPVLFDYMLADGISEENGVPVGEHADLITDPEKKQALLSLLKKFIDSFYSYYEQIYAWEVMNEPSLAKAVSIEKLKIFFREIIDIIHWNWQKATLGCINRGDMFNWTDIGLDIYQFHYYDYMESQFPIDYPAYELGLGKPVLVGEIQPSNISSKLSIVSKNGYAGALFWSLNSDYDFRSKVEDYSSWMNNH